MSIKQKIKGFLMMVFLEAVALILVWGVIVAPVAKKAIAQSGQGPLAFTFLTNLVQHSDFSDTNSATVCKTNGTNSLKCYIDLTSGGAAGTYILAYASGGDVLFCGRTWNGEVETAGVGGTNWKLDIVSNGVTTNVIPVTTSFTAGCQFNWGQSCGTSTQLSPTNGFIRMVSGATLQYATTGTFSAGKIPFSFDTYALPGGGKIQ